MAAASALGLVSSTLAAVPVSATELSRIDDIDCAILVAATLGSQPKGTDAATIAGITAGMTYFVGRYEGAGGRDLKGDMTARYETLTNADMESLASTCGARMQDVGMAMQDAGDALIVIEKRRAATGK